LFSSRRPVGRARTMPACPNAGSIVGRLLLRPQASPDLAADAEGASRQLASRTLFGGPRRRAWRSQASAATQVAHADVHGMLCSCSRSPQDQSPNSSARGAVSRVGAMARRPKKRKTKSCSSPGSFRPVYSCIRLRRIFLLSVDHSKFSSPLCFLSSLFFAWSCGRCPVMYVLSGDLLPPPFSRVPSSLFFVLRFLPYPRLPSALLLSQLLSWRGRSRLFLEWAGVGPCGSSCLAARPRLGWSDLEGRYAPPARDATWRLAVQINLWGGGALSRTALDAASLRNPSS